MYSYGSSARVGGGKRGHGGRNYRPPKEKRDPDVTPPPLRQCLCVVEFNIEEYTQIAPNGRAHTVLTGGNGVVVAEQRHTGSDGANDIVIPTSADNGNNGNNGNNEQHRNAQGHRNRHGNNGRVNHSNNPSPQKQIQELEKRLRSYYQVHLVVPGKKQTGPVALFGSTYRQTIPAAAYLMKHIERINRRVILRSLSGTTGGGSQHQQQRLPPGSDEVITIRGRIFVHNAQDPNPVGITGNWNSSSPSSSIREPFYWLFQSSTWNAIACRITTMDPVVDNRDGDNPNIESSSSPTTSITAAAETPFSSQTGDGRNNDSLSLETVQTCYENATFRAGQSNVASLDVFVKNDFVSIPGQQNTATDSAEAPSSSLSSSSSTCMAFCVGKKEHVD